jgi:glycosyltransferase involved in cell wall biosynthesis
MLVVSFACITAINRRVYDALRRQGRSVEIVVPTEANVGVRRLRPDAASPDGCPLQPLPLVGDNPRLFHYPGLIDLLNQRRPRVVYLDNDPVSRLASDIGRWTRSHGARLICQSCENMPIGFIDHWRRAGWKGLLPAAVKQWLCFRSRPYVDHVFSINQTGADIFRAIGYPSVDVIPLGFDPAVFERRPAARDRVRARLDLNQPVVAYFGRLVRQKGVVNLVRALGRLKDVDWRFLIDRFDLYADPFAGEVDAALDAAGIRDRTVFIEADHVEIADYMNAADMVVLASESTPNWVEQYGRVIPEAMACGVAAIVADSGALPELVGDAGLVVPERDVDALAAAIADLLRDESKRRDLAERGHRRAHEHLALPAQIARLAAHLDESIAKFPASSSNAPSVRRFPLD